ncbi:MAG: hypothetical protein IKX86_04460 [Clostridia bacterium]|nr:hypothetical protein [Clostridia bacterium]MBR5767904.1 hypothetical protein [Clostridia bacterium]
MTLTEIIEQTPAYAVVLPILAGIILAWLIYLFNSFAYGKFVRKLKKGGAVSEETAKTFDDLGIKPNVFLKLSLKKPDRGLRRFVSVSEAGGYFIPEEKQSKAFYSDRDAHWVPVLVEGILIALLVFLTLKLVPLIFNG